jgi:hypothetical protein
MRDSVSQNHADADIVRVDEALAGCIPKTPVCMHNVPLSKREPMGLQE